MSSVSLFLSSLLSISSVIIFTVVDRSFWIFNTMVLATK